MEVAQPTIHLCKGYHRPEEGESPHACRCELGRDHTLIEFWRHDHDREDD